MAYGLADFYALMFLAGLKPEYILLYCGALVIFTLALMMLKLMRNKVKRQELAWLRLTRAVLIGLVWFFYQEEPAVSIVFWALLFEPKLLMTCI